MLTQTQRKLTLRPHSDHKETLMLAVGNVLVSKIGQSFGTEYLHQQMDKMTSKVTLFIDLSNSFMRAMPPISRNTRLRLYELLLGMLADRVIANDQSLSIKMLFEYTNQLPSLIEVAFPGYIESGLFPMIVQSLGK